MSIIFYVGQIDLEYYSFISVSFVILRKVATHLNLDSCRWVVII